MALTELSSETVRTEPFAVAPVSDRRSGVRITGYTGRSTTRLTTGSTGDGQADV